MNGIIDLYQYIAGVIAVILVPGPNSLYCLSVAGQYGARNAYRVIAGIILGDSILILATIFGAGALMRAYPPIFHVIKLAGGLYLAWLGYNLLKGGWLAWQTRRNTQPVTPKIQKQRFFRRALTLSLMNPFLYPIRARRCAQSGFEFSCSRPDFAMRQFQLFECSCFRRRPLESILFPLPRAGCHRYGGRGAVIHRLCRQIMDGESLIPIPNCKNDATYSPPRPPLGGRGSG